MHFNLILYFYRIIVVHCWCLIFHQYSNLLILRSGVRVRLFPHILFGHIQIPFDSIQRIQRIVQTNRNCPNRSHWLVTNFQQCQHKKHRFHRYMIDFTQIHNADRHSNQNRQHQQQYIIKSAIKVKQSMIIIFLFKKIIIAINHQIVPTD
jgi:hypothetical protein